MPTPPDLHSRDPAPGVRQHDRIPTAAGVIARLALERMEQEKVDATGALRTAGLSLPQLRDQTCRFSVAAQASFLEAAAATLRDPHLGLQLAQSFDLRRAGLMYYVLASSDTLGEALRRAERYGRIGNEGIWLRPHASAQHFSISVDSHGVARHKNCQQLEFWLAVVVRICRHLTGRDLTAERVDISTHGSDPAGVFKRLLGRITFGAAQDQITFPPGAAMLPLINTDPYLSKLLLEYCEDAIARRARPRGSIRADVENAIAPMLPHGPPNAEEVARTLGMSYRTLARRLTEEKVTFGRVLTDLRDDLASRYLRDPELTISHIAWLLGYREVSSFTNAFKRRTGRTPTVARAEAVGSDATQVPAS